MTLRPGLSVSQGAPHAASLSLRFPLDLVLYCEAFLTTYRTFITPEELIKKLQYRYPFLAPAPGASGERALGRAAGVGGCESSSRASS